MRKQTFGSKISKRRGAAMLATYVLLMIPSGIVIAESSNMEGKVKTDRWIELAVVIDSSTETLFELWTTEEGVDHFFGSGSNIDARLGGLYEISFGRRPDGKPPGPRGTRILRYEKGKALSFEWQVPYFAHELNTRPLPTWVEVRFSPFSDDGFSTLVEMEHHGFGRSDQWNLVYDFFKRNWFDVLYRLKRYCEGPTGCSL